MKKYEVTFKSKPWYTGYAIAQGPNIAVNLVSRDAVAEGFKVIGRTKYIVREIEDGGKND